MNGGIHPGSTLLFYQIHRRCFDESVDSKKYREQNRVPKSVVDYLEPKLAPALQRATKRNNPLTVREQVTMFKM
jgi:hypothetical protein